MTIAEFNQYEALLWVVVGTLCLVKAASVKSHTERTRLWLALGALFCLFALSDGIEAQTGAWWRPTELLGLKAFCVLGALGVWRLLHRYPTVLFGHGIQQRKSRERI